MSLLISQEQDIEQKINRSDENHVKDMEVSDTSELTNVRECAERVLDDYVHCDEENKEPSTENYSNDSLQPEEIKNASERKRPRVTLCGQLTGCQVQNGKCFLVNENRMALWILLLILSIIGGLMMFADLGLHEVTFFSISTQYTQLVN